MTTGDPRNRAGLSDPRVDAAWRALSVEEPPQFLDAAIMAAARREVGAKPQRSDAREALAARRRWWPLAAAATVAAIAVGVLQLTPPDRVGAPDLEKAVVTDMPAPAAGPAPESATMPPRASEATPAGDSDTREEKGPARSDAQRRPVSQAAVPDARMQAPAKAPEPFPATPAPPVLGAAASSGDDAGAAVRPAPPRVRAESAAPPALEPPAGAGAPLPPSAATADAPPSPAPANSGSAQRARESPAARAAPPARTAAAPTAEATADEARAKDKPPLPVADWIALIRRLRDEGKSADVARELAAFRAAHADHAKLLPPDLRDWRPR